MPFGYLLPRLKLFGFPIFPHWACMHVPDDGYSRNTSCALNLISTTTVLLQSNSTILHCRFTHTHYSDSESISLFFFFLRKSCVLSREATNINCIVFGFTRPWLEPTVCRSQDDHATHYAIDVVIIRISLLILDWLGNNLLYVVKQEDII